jgi:lipopolysaccharide/colanic/teichoic acid biosynthesis glycosyltransferase
MSNDEYLLEPLPPWKRAIDLAVCLVAFPIVAVMSLVAAIVMRLVSPGPVFFYQERVGYRGNRFRLYKFRTMACNADASGHQAYTASLMGSNAPMLKLDGKRDSRLIPGGWLVRAAGLDELPQIINVLRGEMTLVGPRPCLPYEYDNYQEWQQARFNAVPGLTGLWQVSGKNRTTFDEMIRLDIRYSREMSLALDLKIIFLTPRALVAQVFDTRQNRQSTFIASPPPPTRALVAENPGR